MLSPKVIQRLRQLNRKAASASLSNTASETQSSLGDDSTDDSDAHTRENHSQSLINRPEAGATDTGPTDTGPTDIGDSIPSAPASSTQDGKSEAVERPTTEQRVTAKLAEFKRSHRKRKSIANPADGQPSDSKTAKPSQSAIDQAQLRADQAQLRADQAQLRTGPADAAPTPQQLRDIARFDKMLSPVENEPPPGINADGLPEGREIENERGTHYMIRRPLSQLWSRFDAFMDKMAPVLSECQQTNPDDNRSDSVDDAQSAASSEIHPDLLQVAAHFPSRVMYLDLETCGFAGSMVFLIGLVHEHQGQLVLTQLLARSYAEEAAIMETLWQIAVEQRVLVTFNGKSFDWPMVGDRSILHRMQHANDQLVHCDLLHQARRRWKGKVPNCRLQTLEAYLCGRQRQDDIPGREIPRAYHDFVRNQNAAPMRSILHHNALDLVTLMQLSIMAMKY